MIASFVILFFVENLFSKNGIQILAKVFSVTVIIWGLYFRYGWKWPLVSRILKKENLNGTWFGMYKSRNTVTGEIFEGQISLVVRQNFLNINVTSYTNQFVSFSFAETLLHHNNSNSNQLVYLYSQNEYEPIKEGVRRGTSELNLIHEVESSRLFGTFWTNMNSNGSLNVSKLSNKHIESFSKAEEKWLNEKVT